MMDARIYESSLWTSETNPDALKESLNTLLLQANFNCLSFVDNHFSPQGYTALWLLAESHLALHTFPENEKAYIQISCCNEDKYLHFLRLLEQLPQ